MNRKELVLDLLTKTFPAGSALRFRPDSLELEHVRGDDRLESYKATLHWRDGVALMVRVPGDVDLRDYQMGRNLREAITWLKWVAVMKQDGAGSPDLRLNDPDFASRRNIAKQAAQLPFGRALYVRYFTLINC